MNKLLFGIVLVVTSNVSWAAPSESYCLAIGKMTESVAKLRELGVTEEALKEMRVASAAKNTKVQSKADKEIDERNEFAMENVASYVFTVKLESENARLTGFKKCMSGDFTER